MTNRKKVKAEISKNLDKDIQVLADIEVEERDKVFEGDSNRYSQILEQRKQDKREREDAKKQKIHLGKRKHIEKRAIAEVEEQQA
ncbi:hypothetical protein NEF87_000414 [Candidatus Lokiarchaeum ossiferum]|uniref:Uncharacterized protein n=1 Tax=Candidatus Lokiarchaeum ossiferum TaxID=2951803 RepID=A0ABY6HNR3_9ARCH|nr:hypothetical protein NEF87_000414 [Candidatus Lokiarchaeum sp. B-35]